MLVSLVHLGSSDSHSCMAAGHVREFSTTCCLCQRLSGPILPILTFAEHTCLDPNHQDHCNQSKCSPPNPRLQKRLRLSLPTWTICPRMMYFRVQPISRDVSWHATLALSSYLGQDINILNYKSFNPPLHSKGAVMCGLCGDVETIINLG